MRWRSWQPCRPARCAAPTATVWWTAPRMQPRATTPAGHRERARWLHVELADVGGVLGDHLEPRGDVLAHQVGDHLIGRQLLPVLDGDAQGLARARIERRGLERVGVHLAEALEPRDVGLGV